MKLKNWNAYVEETKQNNPELVDDFNQAQQWAQIISTMIDRRNELGLSQRDLAKLCEMPQSSVARIESNQTSPRLETLLNICNKLSLTISLTKNAEI